MMWRVLGNILYDLDPKVMVKGQILYFLVQVRIQRGGGGLGVRTPPGKSQVIWVSIGNKELEPPLEKVGPPP